MPKPEPTKEKIEYTIYSSPAERLELIYMGLELAEFARSCEVKNAIFLDTSARLGWIGLNKMWPVVTKDNEEKPELPQSYFINPYFYIQEDDLETSWMQQHLMDGAQAILGNDIDLVEHYLHQRDSRAIEVQFAEEMRHLVSRKKERTMIVDTCSHSGMSLQGTTDFLEKMGFEDLLTVTAEVADYSDEYEADFNLLPRFALTSCYPWGDASLSGMERNTDSSNLRRSADPEVSARALQARKEIQSIFTTYADEVLRDRA